MKKKSATLSCLLSVCVPDLTLVSCFPTCQPMPPWLLELLFSWFRSRLLQLLQFLPMLLSLCHNQPLHLQQLRPLVLFSIIPLMPYLDPELSYSVIAAKGRIGRECWVQRRWLELETQEEFYVHLFAGVERVASMDSVPSDISLHVFLVYAMFYSTFFDSMNLNDPRINTALEKIPMCITSLSTV